MQSTLNIKARFDPLSVFVVKIWTLVARSSLLELVGGNPERNSHFYCSHHQPFDFFGLRRSPHLHLRGSRNHVFFRLLRFQVVLESFSATVERLVLS